MDDLKKEVRQALKGVILDRQDKAELVDTILNKIIVAGCGLHQAIEESL